MTGRLGLESLEKTVLSQGKGASRPTGSALVGFHVGKSRFVGMIKRLRPSDDRLGYKLIMLFPLHDISTPVLHDQVIKFTLDSSRPAFQLP